MFADCLIIVCTGRKSAISSWVSVLGSRVGGCRLESYSSDSLTLFYVKDVEYCVIIGLKKNRKIC
jgi:hypothetical protein